MNLSNHINVPQQPPNQVINIQTPPKQVINIQTINFRGGEIQQKGRGIGGFSRGLINLVSPKARSEVSSLAKTSVTAKDLAKTLREKAIDSALNMTKDLINGNDMRHSLDRIERTCIGFCWAYTSAIVRQHNY